MIPKLPPIQDADVAANVADMLRGLQPGLLYRFFGLAGQSTVDGSRPWRFPPGDYRLIGVARNVHTWQQQVVYVGVGDRDDGVLYITTLADWYDLFALIDGQLPEPVPVKPPPDAPEKVAGNPNSGAWW